MTPRGPHDKLVSDKVGHGNLASVLRSHGPEVNAAEILGNAAVDSSTPPDGTATIIVPGRGIRDMPHSVTLGDARHNAVAVDNSESPDSSHSGHTIARQISNVATVHGAHGLHNVLNTLQDICNVLSDEVKASEEDHMKGSSQSETRDDDGASTVPDEGESESNGAKREHEYTSPLKVKRSKSGHGLPDGLKNTSREMAHSHMLMQNQSEGSPQPGATQMKSKVDINEEVMPSVSKELEEAARQLCAMSVCKIDRVSDGDWMMSKQRRHAISNTSGLMVRRKTNPSCPPKLKGKRWKIHSMQNISTECKSKKQRLCSHESTVHQQVQVPWAANGKAVNCMKKKRSNIVHRGQLKQGRYVHTDHDVGASNLDARRPVGACRDAARKRKSVGLHRKTVTGPEGVNNVGTDKPAVKSSTARRRKKGGNRESNSLGMCADDPNKDFAWRGSLEGHRLGKQDSLSSRRSSME